MRKSVLFTVFCLAASTPALAGKMEDDPLLNMVKIDQLEWRDADEGTPFVWEGYAWVGRDLNKVWFKTEGERVGGETEDAELQVLYGRAVAPYWDLQFGWRHDFRPEPERNWAVFGVQGVAPYYFEVDASLFVGDDGRSAARLEAEYELLFTQRLILSPEIEVNIFGKDDPAVGIGSGLASVEAGLRLRYEIRREFAPYIGVNYERLFGGTADLARAEGEVTEDLQLVAGVRAWF